MYEPQAWELDDLLARPGTPEVEAYFAAVEARLVAFEALRETLTAEMAEAAFSEALAQYEALEADAARLGAYAYLWFASDTADQDALAFRARVEQFIAEIENRVLFFTLWWKALEDEAAERLMAVSGDVRYFLESVRRFKPHTLDEAVEQAINVKDVNGINAVVTLYDMITNGFEFHLTIEGEEKTLTRGQLSSYVSNPSADLRAAAYQELYRVYAQQADVLAQVYATRARDWHAENVKLRGFASPISVRNLGNDIPNPVVDTLLDVVRQNVGVFQRFFRFKAGVLGMTKLRRYDVYAPLADVEKTYTFDESVRLVDEAYRAFSPLLADKARQVLEARHLDAEVRPRKMDGAFCYGPLPTVTPWVLTNFTGKVQDVSTLAHELGHAVHAMLAADHSPLTFHSALPLAETASNFGEMLLTDKLLAEDPSPAVRRALLSTFLDDAYASVVRQAYFVLFETQAHQMIMDGAKPDDLKAVYMENLREQFGDAVAVSDEFRLEWLVVPHFYHVPFYCYAYTFGNLLVMALYRQYQELGQAFEPDYVRILSYGGSASPDHIMREAGFDMTAPVFWQGGFDLLAERLEELESL